jgi:hypothetical protein
VKGRKKKRKNAGSVAVVAANAFVNVNARLGS